MIPHHIAGEDNIMAYIISCALKKRKFFAASNDLVSYFNTSFPLMQNESWHECQVPSDLLSCMTACLRGNLLTMVSLLRQPQIGRNNGSIGNDMLPHHKSIPSLIHPYLPLNVTLLQEHFLLRSGWGSTEEEIISKFQES